MNNINATVDNVSQVFNTVYKSQAQVTHFGKAGDILRQYDFVGLFPTNIAAIDLDWSNADALEEYTATFSIDYWTTNSGGNAPGAAIV